MNMPDVEQLIRVLREAPSPPIGGNAIVSPKMLTDLLESYRRWYYGERSTVLAEAQGLRWAAFRLMAEGLYRIGMLDPDRTYGQDSDIHYCRTLGEAIEKADKLNVA